jgi:alkanesulfonate monooxygenase SsuD/methylene tetrahydromethanopterin reductase-like flavin-dependent oxidoreductase (luciferase family)
VFVTAAFGAREVMDRVRADHAAWRNTADPALDVAGSPADVRAAIEPFYAAGATSVILQPTGDEPDLEGFMAGVGEVAALLR